MCNLWASVSAAKLPEIRLTVKYTCYASYGCGEWDWYFPRFPRKPIGSRRRLWFWGTGWGGGVCTVVLA